MQAYKLKSIIVLQGVFEEGVIKNLKLSKTAHVFVLEGRPSFEAAQLTCQALLNNGITPTLIADNMAGFLFFKGWVKQVIVACQLADKTGALCDSGALILAVLAKKNKVPVKLLKAKHKARFLGDPSAVAPRGINGYVPLVEWVPVKYLRAKKI